MGTDKRERQKAARQSKIDELQIREKRDATKRRGVLIGGGIVAFVAAVIAFSVLTSDDGDSGVTADGATTTTTTLESSVPEETAISGTPPTTAVTGAPAPAECAPEGGVDEPVFEFEGPFPDCLTAGVDYQAVFQTTKGDIVVDLLESALPNTVSNFVTLARYGYYDGTDLFRTDPSIDIIQGGSPHTQDNSDPGPGYTITDEGGEFVTDESGQYVGPFSYLPGQLIMARSAGPDSSSAQFFFSTGENVSLLDGQGTYLLFGEVTEGLDLLQEIIGLHVPQGSLGGRPSEYVIVESVQILEA